MKHDVEFHILNIGLTPYGKHGNQKVWHEQHERGQK